METQPGPRPPTSERSLGDLFRDLASETSGLMRQELDLARAELRQTVRQLGRDAAGLAIGGGIAGVGGLVLVAFLVAALGDLLGGEYWLGALLVGVLLVGLGVWLALAALRDAKRIHLAPEETLATLRHTQSWASAEAAELRASLAAGSAADGGTAGSLPPRRGAGAPPNRPRMPEGSPPRPYAGDAPAKDRRGPEEALLKRVVHEIQEDDIPGQAAKLAYYAFLALPPAIMAVFGLAGMLGSMEMAQSLQQQAQVALPRAVTDEIIGPFIEQVVLNRAPGPFSIGLLLALWSASGVFGGLMTTLNTAYDVEEDRSFLKRRAIALGVMIASAILFLVAAAALLAGPQIADAIGLGSMANVVWSILQWPLAFAFMVAAFWAAYYVLPNRDQSEYKKVLLKAAAAAALLWVAATAAFRLYIANFSSYSETYGIIGTFIVLLLWFYVTGLVVLAGGELASEMEER